jgi:large-conductance mechanosensitive channel
MVDIGRTIIDTTEHVKNVQKDFLSFTGYNQMFIVTASAICIGIATKDMVTDVMNEAILPVITFITQKSISYFLYTKALEKTMKYPLVNILLQKVARLLWLLLVWLLILYVTYIAFKGLIKLDLVTDKINIIQGVTKYVTRQEQRQPNVQQEKRYVHQELKRYDAPMMFV